MALAWHPMAYGNCRSLTRSLSLALAVRCTSLAHSLTQSLAIYGCTSLAHHDKSDGWGMWHVGMSHGTATCGVSQHRTRMTTNYLNS